MDRASLLASSLIAVALLISPTLAFAQTSPSTSPAADTAGSNDAKTVKVRRGSLPLKISATGTFEPVDPFEIRLRFKAYQGDLYIVKSVEPGAAVKKGETILQIDDTQLKRQLASAESDLAAAQANYTKAQSDADIGDRADALALKMQQDEVQNAENSLKWWEQVDGKQMLEGADLSVKRSKDSVEDQEDELDQLKKMYKSEELTNATADIVVKRALRNLENAKIGLRMTEERASKTKQNDYEVHHARMQYNVDIQKQALERLKAQQQQARVIRQDAVTDSRLALEAAQERLSNLKADAEQFEIRAPRDMTIFFGQLSNGSWQNSNPRSYRVGEKIVLAPGHLPPNVQATGVAPGKLRFVADVPEDKILWVQKGEKATITANSLPQMPFEGTTGEPSRSASGGSGSFDVVVEFPRDLPDIQPGMKGKMKLDAGTAQVLLMPTSAVKGQKVKVRQSDGTEKEVEVVLGRSDGESIEIVSGLEEGAEVVKDFKN